MTIARRTMQGLLTHSMMTPMERAAGRFLRAPDGHDGGGAGKFTQADIDKAVKDAIDAAVEPLKEQNASLFKEAKDAKAKLRAASEIKPEDVAALEAEVDTLKGKLTAAEKAAKDATTNAEKATKALETESAFTSKLLIQDGLKSALIANGVKDEDYIDMAVAKFMGGATVKIDGETRTAMIGDKPLPDAIKEWAGTDAGKKVVAAAVNSGGGAGGGSDKGGGKTISKADFDAKSPKERASIMAEGTTITEAV